MELLVCGGRDYSDWEYVYKVLDYVHERSNITLIIHGAARGADSLAASWAVKADVKTLSFPVPKEDWATHGKKAGIMRNITMLESSKPDLVIAFPGGSGTDHMVEYAWQSGYPVCLLPDYEKTLTDIYGLDMLCLSKR